MSCVLLPKPRLWSRDFNVVVTLWFCLGHIKAVVQLDACAVVMNYLVCIKKKLAGPVRIAQLCHLYSVENILEHNT